MSGLRDELRAIYERNGVLTAPIVVEESRPADAPLHHRFEWDNDVAGDAYRLVQAAQLIREVRVKYGIDSKGRDKTVRAFMSVHRDPADSTYMPTEEAFADDFTRTLLLRECEREWRVFKAKYGSLQEFAAIVVGDMGEVAS